MYHSKKYHSKHTTIEQPDRVGSPGTFRPGPPRPGNAFETPTNRQKMNLIRTFFVLHLSKHRPDPRLVPTLSTPIHTHLLHGHSDVCLLIIRLPSVFFSKLNSLKVHKVSESLKYAKKNICSMRFCNKIVTF